MIISIIQLFKDLVTDVNSDVKSTYHIGNYSVNPMASFMKMWLAFYSATNSSTETFYEYALFVRTT